MNVADIKRGIEDGSLVRTPDGRVRPTSLREQLGLSIVRRLDPKRGVTAQDIIRRSNLVALQEKRRKEALKWCRTSRCANCARVKASGFQWSQVYKGVGGCFLLDKERCDCANFEMGDTAKELVGLAK